MVSCELGVEEETTITLLLQNPDCCSLVPSLHTLLVETRSFLIRCRSEEPIMDPINQTSDNSIAGHTAGDDIPNDGTGMLSVLSASCQLLTR